MEGDRPSAETLNTERGNYCNFCSIRCSSRDNVRKLKKTNLERYGVENVFQSEKIKEKSKQTMLKKYGVEHNSQSPAIKEKKRNTYLKNWGYAHPWLDPNVQEKKKKKFKQSTGMDNISQLSYSDKARTILFNKHKFTEFIKSRSVVEAAKELNVADFTIRTRIMQWDITDFVKYESIIEIEMRKFLDSEKITYTQHNRSIISPMELDFLISDYKLAIEMNGYYWHSSLVKNKDYHYKKWINCIENNIELIQISDTVWNNKRDIIKSMILNKCNKTENTIYARKCEVREIPSHESKNS